MRRHASRGSGNPSPVRARTTRRPPNCSDARRPSVHRVLMERHRASWPTSWSTSSSRTTTARSIVRGRRRCRSRVPTTTACHGWLRISARRIVGINGQVHITPRYQTLAATPDGASQCSDEPLILDWSADVQPVAEISVRRGIDERDALESTARARASSMPSSRPRSRRH
jgi:hypothetical protein